MQGLKNILNGNQRSVLIKKNIIASLIIKGWNSIVLFLLVPVTLLCLNQYEYGVWLTISSVLVWIDQFDIGLGNGLRNKLAESVAHNDFQRARILTSTTLVMLVIIVIPLITFLIFIIKTINCYYIFNVDPSYLPSLESILVLSVTLVGVTFIFKFINSIYTGLQLPAISNLLLTLGKTLSLIVILWMAFIDNHSVLNIALAYTAPTLFVYLLAYPVTFHYYKKLKPSIFLFRKDELCGLFSLGLKFFYVQIAGVIIFASSNLIISKLISPTEVTPYQIAYNYFCLPLMLFMLIVTPLWSATTDAFHKGEWQWIKNVEKRMHQVLLAFLLFIVFMIIIAPFVFHIWIGDEIHIDMLLNIMMGFYIMVVIFSLCYANILFGIGKINMLSTVTIIEAIVFLPLAVFLGRRFDTIGIVSALIIVNSLCAVSNFIQYRKLSKGKATGIWNK